MVGSTMYGSKVPGMKQLMEITKNQPQVTHYIRGYVSMMVLTEALKIADKKGQLNGPGVKAALETLKDFDTGGLTADEDHHHADRPPAVHDGQHHGVPEREDGTEAVDRTAAQGGVARAVRG